MTASVDSFALDQWYVVASAAELPAGHERHTALLGQPIVVSRDNDGVAVVRDLSLHVDAIAIVGAQLKDEQAAAHK